MIRFVDLRGQGIGRSFTFWDTSVDGIVEVNNNTHWMNWKEFEEDFINYLGFDGTLRQHDQQRLQRFKNLCASWVFEVDDAIATEYFDFPNDTVCLAELIDKANQICEKFAYDQDDFEVTSSMQKDDHIVLRLKKPG